MFKTNSSGKRIVSRRRAKQVQKAEEVRAINCISYENCLMTAAKSDADEMPCSQCSRNMDTGGALRSDDPHLKYEVGACLRLLGELFGEKEVDYGFHF